MRPRRSPGDHPTFDEADYPADPYPGARPDHSFVNLDGTCRRVRPAGPWRWRVGGTDLDDWLASVGAAPSAARLPVLAYGSNACPAKAAWLRATLGLTGPVVVLRARCTGIAAVWAAHLRARDGQRPATLAAEAGHAEWHAVWLATPDQVGVLDRCEGRGDRYRLVRLDSGPSVTVTAEDGTALPGVLAYTAAGEARAPLFTDGRPVRCADLAQADAAGLVGVPGPDALAATPVAGAPSPDDWPDRLLAYGTLRPGSRAWALAEPFVVGPPVPTTLPGAPYDTGRGCPAPRAAGPGVPALRLRLRAPGKAFAVLDPYERAAYEGAAYERVRLVDADGVLCWTYVWSAPTTGLRPWSGGRPEAD